MLENVKANDAEIPCIQIPMEWDDKPSSAPFITRLSHHNNKPNVYR